MTEHVPVLNECDTAREIPFGVYHLSVLCAVCDIQKWQIEAENRKPSECVADAS